MKQRREILLLRIVKMLNVVLMLVPVYLFLYRVYTGTGFQYPLVTFVSELLLFAILYCWIGRSYDAFLIQYNRVADLIYSQCLAAAIADFMVFFTVGISEKILPPLSFGLFMFVVQIILAALWCAGGQKWYFVTNPPLRTAIIWDQRTDFLELLSNYGLSKRFKVTGDYSSSDIIQNIRFLDDVDAVFIAGVHSHERNYLVKYCVDKDIIAYVVPRIGDVLMNSSKRIHMFHLPVLQTSRYSPNPEYLLIKRALDIVVSSLALMLISPIMVLTCLAIKLEDGGPVFYKQLRLTQNGKEFYILKFRSMIVNAEKDGKARLSSGSQDDRITKTGRIIRMCRIDELPQLINILKGEMSLVGPRPERPEIIDEYLKELPEFKLRLQAKCGLTGYAQVYGKYNTSPYDKLQMDLIYLAKPSIVQDITIMLATIKILFMPESTEGISESQTTAISGKNN